MTARSAGLAVRMMKSQLQFPSCAFHPVTNNNNNNNVNIIIIVII